MIITWLCDDVGAGDPVKDLAAGEGEIKDGWMSQADM